MAALEWLKANMKISSALELAKASFIEEDTERQFQPHLERMGYDKADTVEDKLYKQLLLMGLSETA